MRTAILVLALMVGASRGQTPDSRGEVVTPTPEYRGVTASAPIPGSAHLRNEGGSDGAGLCVISAGITNGIYQGIPGLDAAGYDEWTRTQKPGKGSKLWRTAKSRPGGYGPDKLASLIEEVMPEEKWASYVGTDFRVLDQLSRMGYPIAATMSTGQLYGYAPIHHDVSLLHYRTNEWACVEDNNDPGKYHWMPAKEFDRRTIDGGVFWAWIWTSLPASGESPFAVAFVALAALGGLAVAFRPDPDDPPTEDTPA